ncbi:unnamed protein product [Hermetia illucens]|uniref:Uncharacterized protein n=1 Tax=Hermetia illucens TaxID=343691 RepID=A0A7R8UMF6_HERIL|nr:flexible cuticle protein 12-like [Hermetia illucens]CAD7083184.1 unnamed protein product [Hermetia illucens]
MKFAIALFAVLAVAAAIPLDDPKVAKVLRLEADNIGTDGYKWGFETSDGKVHDEQGQLKNIGTEGEAIVVRGAYSYTDKDGVNYQVSYVADENGFQPEGAHIPK